MKSQILPVGEFYMFQIEQGTPKDSGVAVDLLSEIPNSMNSEIQTKASWETGKMMYDKIESITYFCAFEKNNVFLN